MKERILPCINYKCAGQCTLGKECYFWKQMQKCSKYIPNKKSQPIRENHKKQKKEQIKIKEFRKGEW